MEPFYSFVKNGRPDGGTPDLVKAKDRANGYLWGREHSALKETVAGWNGEETLTLDLGQRGSLEIRVSHHPAILWGLFEDHTCDPGSHPWGSLIVYTVLARVFTDRDQAERALELSKRELDARSREEFGEWDEEDDDYDDMNEYKERYEARLVPIPLPA